MTKVDLIQKVKSKEVEINQLLVEAYKMHLKVEINKVVQTDGVPVIQITIAS